MHAEMSRTCNHPEENAKMEKEIVRQNVSFRNCEASESRFCSIDFPGNLCFFFLEEMKLG